jgi:hypothetical protein
VVLIEMFGGHLGDKELAAVGVGSGVCHGEASGDIETQVGIEFVFKLITGVAHAGTGWIAALDHEFGNDAMKDGAVVERLVVLLLV